MTPPTDPQTMRVPLGDAMVAVSPPDGWRVGVAERTGDSDGGTHPLAIGPSLPELARGAQNVVIAFTDTTRACPDAVLIPPVLKQLHEAGIDKAAITLLCAVGMHRAITREEMVAKLGAEVVASYRVVSHDPQDIVKLGEVDGVPLLVNRMCVEADLLLATGVVEPHHYAGWSGGGKAVAIGCGGADVIAATHSPRFLDHENVRLGRVEGNPFQRIVQESARRAGLRYVVNVGLSEEGEVVAQGSGPPEAVHAEMVRRMSALSEVAVNAPFDVVVAGVGHPKNVNLYQASRAATYIGLSQHELLKPGGVIILPATCPEGAGQGVGEQNFLDGMANAPDIDTLLDRLRREGCRPGEQRAFILGKVLRYHSIIVVGAQDPDIVHACHMIPASDMDEALHLATEHVSNSDRPSMLVVPHATQTLPVPK